MSVRILIGDCRVRMAELPDASVDSVVCDPPYELGFMSKAWDSTGVANDPAMWRQVLRVLKPGGHLIAFSGTRTYHRMVCAIEDAGFEIRDQLAWVYGSGFPKSLDVSKAIDKARDDKIDWKRLGQFLRTARKARGLTSKQVCREIGAHGEVNNGGAVSNWELGLSCPTWEQWLQLKAALIPMSNTVGLWPEMDAEVWRLNGRKGTPGDAWQTAEVVGVKEGAMSGWSMDGATKFVDREVKAANSDSAREWQGWGTALKPSWEPICLARKPLVGTVAANVLAHGAGALNIDGCRIGTDGGTAKGSKPLGAGKGIYGAGLHGACDIVELDKGRWPANLCHDGSEEVLAGFPAEAGGGFGDSGSAGRFFYCAKAAADERGEGNNHPTVKPIALMRWLVRLVTPKGGTVLDPFMGSGSTLLAAEAEQFNAIGCEMSPEYAAIAERRLKHAGGMFADVEILFPPTNEEAA